MRGTEAANDHAESNQVYNQRVQSMSDGDREAVINHEEIQIYWHTTRKTNRQWEKIIKKKKKRCLIDYTTR